jgi:hypothetical protein
MKLLHIIGIAISAIALSSCTDSDDLNIGGSLTAENDKIDATSANFAVSTRTIQTGNILSRSNECYFGRIQDPETGATVTSEFMSQFGILESFSLPSDNNILSRYDNMAGADSCFIDLYIYTPSSCSDDSAVLKMKISEMDKPAEETEDYYSDFDPAAEGLIRQDGLTVEESFSYASIEPLADAATRLAIPANKPYTDKDGKTYNNYGTYLMQQYYHHPEYFRNSYSFIHHVCPGFYFQITDGYGFHSPIPYVGMRVFFHMKDNDSTFVTSVTFSGTDEVLQTTKINNDPEILASLTNDNSCTYLKSPAGLITEVTIPIDDIMRGHENDSLLAANINFPRINNDNQKGISLDIPRNLLLIHKDSLETFFRNNKLTDNETSFLNNTTVNSAGKTVLDLRNIYTYDNISNLITYMVNARRQGQSADPNWTAKHPDWNRAVLVPVSLIQTTSSNGYNSTKTTTGIRHNMSLTSTKLVGGSQNQHDPITLNVVYAKYKRN